MKQNLIQLAILLAVLPFCSVNADSTPPKPEVAYPDPQRWTDTINEYKKWDSKNAYPKDAVLFVGSSSIVYWKTADFFPDLPIINRGFGGSYTADALYYVNELVIKYKPKVVIIYEGDNDIAGSIPPRSVHQDFVHLTDAIHAALPQTEIICLPVKICSQRWILRGKMKELNQLNKTYSEIKDYITFVDTAMVLLKEDGTPKDEFFASDKLHLNDKGYAQWNALLTPVIEKKYSIAIKKSDGQ